MTSTDLPATAAMRPEGSPASTELAEAHAAHAVELVRFATILVGRHDAPDVVSSAFTRAWTAAGWRDVANPRAYLYRIVANEAHNLRRGQGRRAEREHRDHMMRELTSLPLAESALEVRQGVARLSVRQRAVVFLTYWADMPDAEIAETLGISPGSVRRHLARARTHLRRILHG
ncbi:MAG: RNA polymerase sigma factor [Acidimicrobiia bacterium]|nr:RNA polymerase sigma factor [Acidimicrobiia bacterium]